MICFLSGGRGSVMSLVEQLTRVIHEKKYRSVTFSINAVPVVTVNFLKDGKVTVLLNNMEELRCFELTYNGDTDKFVSYIEDILIYSGVDPMIRKMKVSYIDFHGEPYLEGKVLENKIIITQQDVMFDDDNDEVTFKTRDEVTAVIELTGHTLAQIIGAFAVQLYN